MNNEIVSSDVEMLPEPWLTYYKKLIVGVDRAKMLREQSDQMLAEAVKHESALNAFADYLPELGLEGVGVNRDGQIFRNNNPS